MGNWKEIPTLQSLISKRSGRIGDIWIVPLLKNITQLEAIYSALFWLGIPEAAVSTPKLQVLHLSMI